MRVMLFILGLGVAFDALLRIAQDTGALRVFWIVFLVVWCVLGFLLAIFAALRGLAGRGMKLPANPWVANPPGKVGDK